MSQFDDYDRHGEPWSVFVDLATTSGTLEIVRPTPLRRDPASNQGDRYAQRMGLVITGFAYHMIGNAGGEGFRLLSRGTDNLPRIRWEALLPVPVQDTFAIATLSVTPCFIPLYPADPRDSPSSDGDSLFIQIINVARPGSGLAIWGIHTSSQWGDRGYTGSPAIFPG